MTTTTIEEQLAELRTRIDRLQALAQVDAAAHRSRIQRHLDALHHEEASVLAAARRAPDEVDAKLGQLQTRVALAEQSALADLSDDWATYAAAVEGELRGWDSYLERLQTSVATRAWHAREQARNAATNGWQQQRERVGAARDELEQKADELSAKLN